jgi:transketolase
MTMTYEETLFQLACNDERIVVLTAENRAAIRNIPARLGNRFIDVGIAEQTMVGTAAGLALRGRLPVVHALATFLTMRAFEFIRTDVGISALPVTFVGAVPGLLSDGNGPTHQALEDVALMRGIPHMQVFCPADAAELCEAVPAIVRSGAPSYIRYVSHAPAVTHTAPFEPGKAEVLSAGNDVAILTYGFLLREATRAREVLEARNLSVRLLNLRSLKPVDEQALLEAARSATLVVTLEDHFMTGGLASILAEVLLRHRVTCTFLPIAFEERWFRPARLDDVLSHEGFTGEQVAAKILTKLERLS